MDDDALAMVVEFRAAPGRRSELLDVLLGLVLPTRDEDGCLRYDLHEDREDPDVLAFYEVWRDAAAHAAHDLAPHVRLAVERIPGLTTSVRVQRLRLLGP